MSEPVDRDSPDQNLTDWVELFTRQGWKHTGTGENTVAFQRVIPRNPSLGWWIFGIFVWPVLLFDVAWMIYARTKVGRAIRNMEITVGPDGEILNRQEWPTWADEQTEASEFRTRF